MGIEVKLRCSECETIREVELKQEEKEIDCVICGRRMANLTAEEFSEIGQQQKSQRTMGIIALVCLFLAVICVIMWAGDSAGWASGYVLDEQGKAIKATGPIEPNMGMFIGFCVTGLASLVLSIMASMKRHVVEF
ncbi:MAG TPA: hypothetical protein VEJ63_22240 [Planctomycetota bacterium]|nr:hypothetical protein [Planctomycetota bacterium]